jgi:hypothetical protein
MYSQKGMSNGRDISASCIYVNTWTKRGGAVAGGAQRVPVSFTQLPIGNLALWEIEILKVPGSSRVIPCGDLRNARSFRLPSTIGTLR